MRWKHLPWLIIFLLLIGCQQTLNETEISVSPSPTVATAVALSTITPSQTPTSTTTAVPTITSSATAPPIATVMATAVASTTIPNPPGALIQVTLNSQVGVLLDELPPDMRERVAEAVLTQGSEAWQAHAARQIQLTRLRLNFRDYVYPEKGQLPLPPQELWQIELDAKGAQRQTIQGHDLVTIGYTFTTTILTDETSPGIAEPTLADVGGIWQEPFVFPADPNLLLQRTNNACINEAGFPPNSYDSENAGTFFDFECTTDSRGPAGCHRTVVPSFSCREALAARVGEVETFVRFERLPWSDELANQVRLGEVQSANTADLAVVAEDLAINRIVYRYIEGDDCTLDENAVGGSGWRRLLQFSATVHNDGGEALHIGRVQAEDPANNAFVYNICHDHFHYSNYGNFFIAEDAEISGSKQAFCVQSTNRLSNNEVSPLTHDYSCTFQGIQTGWVDEYIAGLDVQWIDITDLEIPAAGQTVGLGFTSNEDRFLCEGEPVLDENGAPVWEPTGFTTDAGASINRPQCNFIADWDANNEAVQPVFVPAAGSFVTAVCSQNEIGPLRNCGFVPFTPEGLDLTCQAGETQTLNLQMETAVAPQVVRVCEQSAVLGTGVACTYTDALANVVVGGGDGATAVTFTCPLVRDAAEPVGAYSLYSAPVWPVDTAVAPALSN